MNKIFILGPITMKKLVVGTIWIRYSPYINFVQS